MSASPAPVVDVRAWSHAKAFALVEGIPVRVVRTADHIRWRCSECGDQLDRPTCSHARAFADTPLPDQEF
ncbi:MAG TPA: hypothetical protein VGN48_17935 [Pedococcus sp.]|jgi:hypothetical protein|nr:hypothetical protein [Pedococcus sp.]